MGNDAEGAHADSGWGDLNDELGLEKDSGKSTPIKIDLLEEERLDQLEAGGILTARQAEKIIKQETAQRLNAIAEALTAHIETKLHVIGAHGVRAITIPENTNGDLLELKSRVEIEDLRTGNSKGAKFYIDIRIEETPDKKIAIREIYIPPTLNAIKSEIQSIFDHMKEYGKLSPHSI